MTDKISSFTDSLRNEIDKTTLVYSDWLEKNFKDPGNDRKAFSFDNHEFQIDIINEQAQDVVVKKCAQIGLTTLQIRYVLAFCAVNQYKKVAYILPTARFASEVSATRVQPAIDSSSIIKQMAKDSETDNVNTKQIGTNWLMLKGTSGTTAAISADLDAIITDELDFCNIEVVGSFSSRLQHSDLKLTRKFSTPTVSSYGIDKEFQDSSQAERAVYHDACNTWQVLDFYRDIVIPGFHDPVKYFSKDHASIVLPVKQEELSRHPSKKLVHLSCPNCNKPVSQENLNDPSKRKWVHRFPDNPVRGYQCRFWDVPKYNHPHEVMASISSYTLHQDFINFRIGETYEDKETGFTVEAIEAARKPTYIAEDISHLLSRNAYIGIDLGKVSHIVIGVATPTGIQVVYYGTIDVKDLADNKLSTALLRIIRQVRAVKVVCDAMPNHETALQLVAEGQPLQCWGAYYTNGTKTSLDIYNFKDNQGILNIARTPAFDQLARAFNSGVIKLCRSSEAKIDTDFNNHLLAMKKIREVNSKEFKWINTGADHYAHALGYMYAGYMSVEQRYIRQLTYVAPTPSKIALK